MNYPQRLVAGFHNSVYKIRCNGFGYEPRLKLRWWQINPSLQHFSEVLAKEVQVRLLGVFKIRYLFGSKENTNHRTYSIDGIWQPKVIEPFLQAILQLGRNEGQIAI